MQFGSDSRAQSIQVGVVLLFGILVVFLSLYQAFVVPGQNESVEVNHNQAVQDDMVEVRNAVVSTADDSTSRSVSVRLGTSYPSRALFVNPGPASGALRTAGTGNATVNVTIENASAVGDAGDFWNGTPQTYSTGSIVYQPNYNVYQRPPRTIYENTVLYNKFDQANTTLTGQTLVDGNRLRLVTLTGTISASKSGTVSVDVSPVSVSSNRVSVQNVSADRNVTLTIPSRLPLFKWEELLADQRIDEGGNVVSVDSSPHPAEQLRQIHIELKRGVAYQLRLAHVGTGTDLNRTDPAYLQRIRGNGTTVPEQTERRLVVEVRDSYNNPVSGVTVNATTARGDSDVTNVTESDADGQATLTYKAPEIDGGAETDRVNVSFDANPDSGFDPNSPTNATFSLTIDNADASGTGQGGLDVEWLDPSNAETGPCDAADCTWSVSDDADGKLLMNASTEPAYAGITADFSVDNRSVATPEPSRNTTATTGNTSTALQPAANGTTGVYVSVSGRSDLVNVTITDYNPSYFGTGGKIVYNSSNGINGDGGTETKLGPGGIGAFGPLGTDISGNGKADLPYVDENGFINLTDDETTGVKETLVDPNQVAADEIPETEKTLLGAGTWNGSDPSVFYVDDSDSGNTDNQVIYRVNATGPPTVVADLTSGPGAQAVSGPGDVDGDGTDELLFLDGDQQYRYLEPNGTVSDMLTVGQVGSSTGIGAGQPPDFDADGVVSVVFVDDSNNVRIGAKGESDTTFTGTDAAKSPLTAADVDDDGRLEIVYPKTDAQSTECTTTPNDIDNPSVLKYVDDPLGNNPTREVLKNDNGDCVFTDKQVGVVS